MDSSYGQELKSIPISNSFMEASKLYFVFIRTSARNRLGIGSLNKLERKV